MMLDCQKRRHFWIFTGLDKCIQADNYVSLSALYVMIFIELSGIATNLCLNQEKGFQIRRNVL